VSELLSLLYRGQRAEALALLAADPPPVLDIFEAAAAGSHPRVAELLRADAAFAQAWTDDGFTALHLVCFFGTPDAALDLLEAGADPNVASRNAMGVRRSTVPPPAESPSTRSACSSIVAQPSMDGRRAATPHSTRRAPGASNSSSTS
jgi:ankyrin repeat protein